MKYFSLTAIALFICLSNLRIARGADAWVVATSDTEGRAVSSEGPTPSRSMAQRATVMAKLRQRPVLLIDTGNSFFGEDSTGSAGKMVAAAYKALAYDAVNISFRDLRLGKAATLELVRDSSLPAISANLLDEQTRKPLFDPYVVRDIGGQKVAILGVTEAPAGLDSIKHLKQQLAGVTVQSPLDALAQWLPEAKGKSQRLVLAYYGSAAGLASIVEKFGADFSLIVIGGIRPEFVPESDRVTVAGVADHGTEVALVKLVAAGEKAKVVNIAIDEKVAADPAMDKLMAPFVKARAANLVPPAASGPPSPVLRSVAANAAVQLRITANAIQDLVGKVTAAPGRKLLILSTVWENIIPLQLTDNKALATQYQVPNLADHLYLVVNGRELSCIHRRAGEMPSHVPVKNFRIDKAGDRLSGDVVFEVPAEGVESLDLRLYDYAHGHFSLPLVVPAKAIPQPKSLAEGKNQVVEMGVFAFRKSDELAGKKAPAGMTYALLGLRGRSAMSVEADASHFDSKAAKGAKIKLGSVADWKESRKYIQLVADGEFAYSPLDAGTVAGTLDPEPRFLPDVMTGGQLAFLVPDKTQSLALRCDFPNAQVSTGGKPIRPDGITLKLEGTAPSLTDPSPVATVKDDIFDVAVTGQKAGSEFAGRKAADGSKFLCLDVTIRNSGPGGEFFQTKDQLQYTDKRGKSSAFDAVSSLGVHPTSDVLWIPGGQRRSFQVVYRIDSGETKPRLSYRGVSMAKVIDLPALDAGAAVVPPPPPPDSTTKPSVTPPEKTPDTAVKPPDTRPDTQPVVVSPPPVIPPVKPLVVSVNKKWDKTAAAVTAKQDAQAKGIAGVGLKAEQVNAAIDLGADFLWKYLKEADLKKRQRKLGDDYQHVLCMLAMVHAGAHKRMPDFDQELRGYLNRVQPSKGLGMYQAGLFCMLVESYGEPAYMPKLRDAARYLLEAQGKEGTWTYNANVPPEIFADPKAAEVLRISGGTPLEGPGAAGEPWTRLRPIGKNDDGDNSVSQFALLGLQAASRCGIVFPREVWEQNLAACRKRQIKDGGWAYSEGGNSYGSMSCAGICAVAINRHLLGEKDPLKDESLEMGLGWLARNFAVNANPGRNDWNYYYLYSVERVGRILDTEFIGPHEWYPKGARHLVDAQKPDGSWVGQSSEYDPRLTTSFALLFLTRATPTLDVAVKRGGNGTLKTAATAGVSPRVYIILDASGSMLEEIDGKRKFDIARDAVADLVKELPAESEVALRVYGHRKTALDEGASEDTNLEIRMVKLQRQAFAQKLTSIRPVGKTPLALSLKEAAGDLRGGGNEKEPITVLLLTDGGEDTQPRQDPIAAAKEIGKLKNIRFNIVGFDIGNREDWNRELQGISEAGSGRYWSVGRAGNLLRELRFATLGTPEQFTVLDKSGSSVARGAFGEQKTLPEGKYALQTDFAGRRFEQTFWINTDSATSVVFNGATALAGRGGTTLPSDDKSATQPPGTPPANPPVKSAAKFCTQCGGALKDGAKFCTQCGAKTGQ